MDIFPSICNSIINHGGVKTLTELLERSMSMGFIDLNEFGFSLEVLCKKSMKSNTIRHIYNVFDPESNGFFNEDGFVQNLLAFNQSIGENIEEMSLRK